MHKYKAVWLSGQAQDFGEEVYNGVFENLESCLDSIYNWMDSTEAFGGDRILIYRGEDTCAEFLFSDDGDWIVDHMNFGTKEV